jgi:O-6-methylguanine DNA methyltransferase
MNETGAKSGVDLWLRRLNGAWFGVAEAGGKLVATSVAQGREEASRILLGSLPSGAPSRFGEGPSTFADAIAGMLAAIEAGDESGKSFELSRDFLPDPTAKVYALAASIPLGFATSYGRLAEAAGAIAREVGRLMASNPLYPLVPCHRVVGSDYSLVGYRGTSSGPDLDAKLARLRAEARGFRDETAVAEVGGLVVFPVEWVIAKAERDRACVRRQLSLW